jgi:hypothetical protein
MRKMSKSLSKKWVRRGVYATSLIGLGYVSMQLFPNGILDFYYWPTSFVLLKPRFSNLLGLGLGSLYGYYGVKKRRVPSTIILSVLTGFTLIYLTTWNVPSHPLIFGGYMTPAGVPVYTGVIGEEAMMALHARRFWDSRGIVPLFTTVFGYLTSAVISFYRRKKSIEAKYEV